MMKKDTINHVFREKGFTLLLSVLISGIILAIGIAIFNITFKELRLSSAGRESQFAFYAADSGAECALFHDRKNNAFSTSSPEGKIVCAEQTIPITLDVPLPGVYRREFSLELEPNRYCASVTITKEEGPPVKTTIESRGTNTCNVSDARRVERAIEVTY